MRNRTSSALASAMLALLIAGCNQTEQAMTPTASDVEQAQAASRAVGAGDVSAALAAHRLVEHLHSNVQK